MELRDHFQRILRRRQREVRRAALLETLRKRRPALGDLLALLDEDSYLVEPDDLLTVKELLGEKRGGPTLVELLEKLGLPLNNPLDAADELDLDEPLHLLLASLEGGLDGPE